MGPSDAIWRHRNGSPLVQVMACCLTVLRWQGPDCIIIFGLPSYMPLPHPNIINQIAVHYQQERQSLWFYSFMCAYLLICKQYYKTRQFTSEILQDLPPVAHFTNMV